MTLVSESEMMELIAQPDPTSQPLRRIRLALQMTLGDLSKESGLKLVAVSEIERQTRYPTEQEFRCIHCAFTQRMIRLFCDPYVTWTGDGLMGITEVTE